MCSKVLNGHIILTDTSITTILAPEMTYTPFLFGFGVFNGISRNTEFSVKRVGLCRSRILEFCRPKGWGLCRSRILEFCRPRGVGLCRSRILEFCQPRGWGFAVHEFWGFVSLELWSFAGHEFWSFVGQEGGALPVTNSGVLSAKRVGLCRSRILRFCRPRGWGLCRSRILRFCRPRLWELCRSRILEFCRPRGWGFAGHEFWSFVGQEVWNSIGLGSWALLAMKSGTLSAMNNPLRRADALHSFEQYRHTCEPIPRRSRMLPQNADRTVPFSDASTIAATTPASIIVEIAAMQDVHMNVIVAALRFGPLDDAFREGRQCLERL